MAGGGGQRGGHGVLRQRQEARTARARPGRHGRRVAKERHQGAAAESTGGASGGARRGAELAATGWSGARRGAVSAGDGRRSSGEQQVAGLS